MRLYCGGGAVDPATLLRDRHDAWLDVQLDADASGEPLRATCRGSEQQQCASWLGKLAEAGTAPPRPLTEPGPHAGAQDITEAGVGPVRLTMTRAKAAAALGPPDEVEKRKSVANLSWELHHYRAKGVDSNLADVITRMGVPFEATPLEATYFLGKTTTLVVAFDGKGQVGSMRLVFTP